MKRILAGLVLALTFMSGGSAHAQVCDAYSGACPSETAPPVAPSPVPAENPGSELPVTGGQLVGTLLVVGAGLLTGGTIVRVAARRKS